MQKNKKKHQPEAAAPEDNIPNEPTMEGLIEMAMLDAAHGTAKAFKLKEAELQMEQGEPVPLTIFLANDSTGLQTIIEGCPEEGTFCAFAEILQTAIARVAPLRSTFGFHIKGAKHLLSATEEALIFLSASYSGLSVSVAVPILRSPTGDFLTFGEEFDIQWDPKLLRHAFGENEADSSLPSQDQLEGKLWGNN